jgi:hypothetical protein
VAEPWEIPSPSAPPLRRTNGWAVAGVVFGALGACFLGIVFGIVALVQIRRSGEPGRGTAILGIVLSCLWIAGITYAATHDDFLGPPRDSRGAISSDGTLPAVALEVGDCVNGLADQEEVSDLPAVPCTKAHHAEVYAILSLPRTEFPGDDALSDLAQEKCGRAFDELDGLPPGVVSDPGFTLSWLQPFQADWVGGDRRITCLVATEAARTGSFRQQPA